ncbi:unnamed protein product [marine sediment metagenome]|uniref:Uncharacterized protein n=1 Tax=marine sediment metagenome TaxID=412755 RepID=X1LNH5_9ZZZZ
MTLQGGVTKKLAYFPASLWAGEFYPASLLLVARVPKGTLHSSRLESE